MSVEQAKIGVMAEQKISLARCGAIREKTRTCPSSTAAIHPKGGTVDLDYAESNMKRLHLALSWRTETIKSIRHSREGVTGLSERPIAHRQADSDLLLR